MDKLRLDKELVRRGLVATRSRADDVIRRGFVMAGGALTTNPGLVVDDQIHLSIMPKPQFVSRAGEKLFSVLSELDLQFKDRVVLDVGSSTGGFTDLALREGARKVIAVDIGTNQLHPGLRGISTVELHEKTDIKQFQTSQKIDIVLIDVSFISLREILPYVVMLTEAQSEIVAMVKPQFEVGSSELKNRGVIKNDHLRREILKNFENWVQPRFIIEAKADSKVAGAKGNIERFYRLRSLSSR
jgi:23S rRNA (cytidine1920-2'-O)/16S rRNA (cytidine1409-2'-O)-methyltransferase